MRPEDRGLLPALCRYGRVSTPFTAPTYEVDEKYGTSYLENFKKFLQYAQEKDLTADGAMTDPKGDRSLAPHAQADPDLVPACRGDDGPTGSWSAAPKAHQTGFVNSHEVTGHAYHSPWDLKMTGTMRFLSHVPTDC